MIGYILNKLLYTASQGLRAVKDHQLNRLSFYYYYKWQFDHESAAFVPQ